MAALVLQVAGAAVGSVLGGPIGAVLGQAIGATAGAVIDRALFATPGKNTVGPRLTNLAGLTSSEGAAVPRVYGRARVGGQLIWSTRFEEVVSVTRAGSSGGKATGASKAKQTTYSYFANVAIGLCEGPVADVRRVWADGKELDVQQCTMRVYRGDAAQDADPLIVAKEGAGDAPAYRGLAYVVFERLALENFGNRVPQLSFEVIRPAHGLADMIRGVDIIPGATEFGYDPVARVVQDVPGQSVSANRHQLTSASDWSASIDALQALCPNLTSVALVVAWFGDDLRAGHCTIAPRVETATKNVLGTSWSVAGLTRGAARLVSQIDGGPAYGGTPSDASVTAAIADLRARGLSVVFYPFVMMDVAPGNALPDPYGRANQPAFPWRGRITCDPAPGQPGTADATGAAAAQVAAFFGSAAPLDDEWSYRRFVLHCAQLCADAGGVDAFLVGSELAALTRVRAASGVYPAANALAALAGDVKALLGGGTLVSYSADWTELGTHVLDGGAEVRFPLDVVWSSPSVDFVGIDAYWPLSDWRDGTTHADAAVARSAYDPDYLRARVGGGEGYDWYYSDDAARAAQVRTPISDGAFHKPWMFRAKDLVGWWSQPHVQRAGGVEVGATGWVPQGKPIWIIETGCPAVDRGANAPNVFPDPKSSESALPPFSRGFRDDLAQARALEAVLGRFDPRVAGFAEPANPASALYAGRMVDPDRIHVWAWDARPFPAFPAQAAVWSDAANWETGHWLNGRLEGVPLDRLVAAIIAETRPDLPPVARPALDGFVDGYVLDRVLSVREALDPLTAFFGFDCVVSADGIRFADRGAPAALALTADDCVPDKDGRILALTRAQEGELPHEIAVSFVDGEGDYQQASVLSRRIEGGGRRQASAETALVIGRAEAQRRGDMWLQDLWMARETAQVSVRPGLLALEVGDAVTLPVDGGARLFAITRITDSGARAIEARAIEPSVYDAAPPIIGRRAVAAPRLPGPAHVPVLDLAVARDTPTTLQYVAAFADPWPGALALWRASGDASFDFARLIEQPAIVGVTLDTLGPGPVARLDRANAVHVRLFGGALASVSDVQMLAGGNAAALRGPDGAWEIIGFAQAELVAADTYRLSRLLRGQGGETALAARTLAEGADFVLLDRAVVPLVAGLSDLGAPLHWRIGPADRDYTDASTVEFSATAGAKSLMPLAPVHPSARRSGAGVTFAFLRCGRIDADGWAPLDIPLGEDVEGYDVAILHAGAVVRVLTCATPSVTYAASDEITDFGAPQSAFDLRVTQRSATVGAGFALLAHVPVA